MRSRSTYWPGCLRSQALPGNEGRRGGFTLVELLVTMSIIAILVALSVGGGYKVVGVMRVNATENAMRSVNKSLEAHWKKVIDEANGEVPTQAVMALANTGQGVDPALARVLWTKFRLAEAFPQSFNEIRLANAKGGFYGLGPGGQPYITLQKYMPSYGIAIASMNTSTHDPSTESAACLYLSLRVSRGGVKLDEANLAGFIGDTDSDGVLELIDRWGHALHFQRFVTSPYNNDLALLNPRANQAKSQFADPLDPDGLCQQIVTGSNMPWYKTPQGKAFTALVNHPFPGGQYGPQPYAIPYIVSNGPDEVYGTTDDIFGFRLKVGSQ